MIGSHRDLQVAVIGSGFGAQHLAWLAGCSGAKARLLVYHQDQESADSVSRRWDVPQVTSNITSALSGDIDIVSVVTPVNTHLSIARRAIAAGKIVVCEKPLATSYREAEEIREAAGGRLGMVMFQWRFHPAAATLRGLVAGGLLGQLVAVQATFHHDFLADSHVASGWRHDVAQAGAGAFGDQGIHLIDLMRWLTGSDYLVESASATTVYPIRGLPEARVNCATEDVGMVLLRSTADGHLANLVASRVSGGFRSIQVSVHGTGGSAVLEIFPETAEASLRASHDASVRRWPAGALANPYTALVDAIRTGDQAAVPSFDDAVRAQRILDQIVSAIRIQ